MFIRRYLNKFLIIMTDVTVIYASIGLAYYVRTLVGTFTNIIPLSHGPEVYFSKWWIPAVIIGSITYHKGYGIVVSFWDDVVIAFKSLFFAFLIVWMLLSLQKEAETVSRMIITGSFIIMAGLLLTFRSALKFLLYKVMSLREKARIFSNVPSSNTDSISTFLRKEWYAGYMLNNSNSHPAIEKSDAVFVPLNETDENTIKELKKNARDLIIVSELYGLSFMNTQIKTFVDRNIALIATRNGLLLRRKVLLKRGFDVTLAVTALIALSPLFIFIPCLIRLDSKGPVFFRHSRCGRNMKEFKMNKFRTMDVNGDGILRTHLEQHPEALIDIERRNKMENDPRVTKLGRFLRMTSLDELPQLFNVITGTMSIVGPRPDTVQAIREYRKEYSEIYEHVRPGLTGLWQVSGRSDIEYAERVKLDNLYMLNWSLFLDIVIISKTFKTLLNHKGAY